MPKPSNGPKEGVDEWELYRRLRRHLCAFTPLTHAEAGELLGAVLIGEDADLLPLGMDFGDLAGPLAVLLEGRNTPARRGAALRELLEAGRRTAPSTGTADTEEGS